MTKLLIRLFVKKSDSAADPRVRETYGRLAGLVGIACNLLLGCLKFLLGAVTGSIAIQADGVNNLADMVTRTWQNMLTTPIRCSA